MQHIAAALVKAQQSKNLQLETKLMGEKNPQSKLTAEQVAEIRRMVSAGAMQKEACALFHVSPMTVSRIVRQEAWV